MTTTDSTLHHISDLVQTRVEGHLPDDVHVDRVFSEFLPTADEDEYIRTTVVLEDGHPKLDARLLNEFSRVIHTLCMDQGLRAPSIAYANKSELT